MTNEEKQEIISAVIASLSTNSKSIAQLTAVSSMSDDDLIELGGGRKVTYAKFIEDLVTAINGKLSASALNEALANYIPTDQLFEALPGMFAAIDTRGRIVFNQARCVMLESMGSTYDDIDGGTFTPTKGIGCMWYTNKSIMYRNLNNQVESHVCQPDVLYVNTHTGRLYKWSADTQEMVEMCDENGYRNYRVIDNMTGTNQNNMPVGATWYFISDLTLRTRIDEDNWFITSPDPHTIYANRTDHNLVVWDGVDWLVYGSNSTGGLSWTIYNAIQSNVNTLQATVDDLIAKLANIAYKTDSRPSAIGEFGWPDNDSYPETEPALTSPLHNSTLSIGQIAADGTSRSASLSIKGSNLTQPLGLSVTGTGFSLSKSTLTAAEANAGAIVTVTYTNTGTGDGATKTGFIEITSQQLATVKVNLTASKAAPDAPEYFDVMLGSGSTGVKLSSNEQVEEGNTLSVYLQPLTGYTLPSSVTITENGTPVSVGSGQRATYDSGSGLIQVANVRGAIEITATGVPVSATVYKQKFFDKDDATGTDGFISAVTGNVTPIGNDTTWRNTPMIPIPANMIGTGYFYWTPGYNGTATSSSGLAWYNADGDFISGIKAYNASQNASLKQGNIPYDQSDPTKTAAYVRFTGRVLNGTPYECKLWLATSEADLDTTQEQDIEA